MVSRSLLEAAQLRVCWEDRGEQAMLNQIIMITDLREARDLIITLAMTRTVPTSQLRKVLPEGF